MDHQIGSLKEGKLADIIVIDGNPLENIRDTEHVTHTMINGRLYDAATMNEIGNTEKKRGTFNNTHYMILNILAIITKKAKDLYQLNIFNCYLGKKTKINLQ